MNRSKSILKPQCLVPRHHLAGPSPPQHWGCLWKTTVDPLGSFRKVQVLSWNVFDSFDVCISSACLYWYVSILSGSSVRILPGLIDSGVQPATNLTRGWPFGDHTFPSICPRAAAPDFWRSWGRRLVVAQDPDFVLPSWDPTGPPQGKDCSKLFHVLDCSGHLSKGFQESLNGRDQLVCMDWCLLLSLPYPFTVLICFDDVCGKSWLHGFAAKRSTTCSRL